MSRGKRTLPQDPVLRESPPFPHALGCIVNVEHNGSLWRAKIHRIAVNEATCSVLYCDGSVESNVLPARICQAGSEPEQESTPAPAPPTALPVPDPDPAPQPEPRFITKASVAALNKCFERIMRGRLKRLKHRCRWCCPLRHDMPYFAAKAADDERGSYFQPELVHGTVEMTSGCNLRQWSSIQAIDDYLQLNGELMAAATQASCV